MGYELNTDAYRLFIQIEVGIREFLIDLIKQKGVFEWYTNFLGQFQREAINVIITRIQNAKKRNVRPSIEDQFQYKLNRVIKDNYLGLKCEDLYHPFYYLNWPDMEMVLNKKTNTDLIENVIGKKNRDVVSNNLKLLNELRNHIAHSRFITEEEFVIIKSAFEQISAVIPNFNKYYNNQTKEDKLDVLLKKLRNFINTICAEDMISIPQIEEFDYCINMCLNSFWLNSLYPEIIEDLSKLNSELNKYKSFRSSIGGIMPIIDWKKRNTTLFCNILNKIENGEI